MTRVARPTLARREVQQGSQIIYQAINQILNGQDAKNVLPGMAQRLDRSSSERT